MRLLSTAMVASCVLFFGCRQDVQTIWSSEARSPDGHWLATAKTTQHFGPGTAGIETTVQLKFVSNPPTEILVFSHDGNDTSRTINLAMKWVTPTHLDLTYNGRASLDFQVVKCGGVEISVRVVPDPGSRRLQSSVSTLCCWSHPGPPPRANGLAPAIFWQDYLARGGAHRIRDRRVPANVFRR